MHIGPLLNLAPVTQLEVLWQRRVPGFIPSLAGGILLDEQVAADGVGEAASEAPRKEDRA